VAEALLWGALAASSLVIGALLGVARQWSPRLVGLVLGFGAGALISAVSFELFEEGARVGGGAAVAAGLAAGRPESAANAPTRSCNARPSRRSRRRWR
jgi:zinc transporter, ZIP family